MHLSHPGMSKKNSWQNLGSCIHSHSQIAISTSSLLWNSQLCFSCINYHVYHMLWTSFVMLKGHIVTDHLFVSLKQHLASRQFHVKRKWKWLLMFVNAKLWCLPQQKFENLARKGQINVLQGLCWKIMILYWNKCAMCNVMAFSAVLWPMEPCWLNTLHK
jgi:hypothetical protein